VIQLVITLYASWWVLRIVAKKSPPHMQINSQDLLLPNFALQNRNAKMTYVNKTSVLGIGVLFIISNISAVSARFYVRRTKAGYGLDDWLCIPALVRRFVAFVH